MARIDPCSGASSVVVRVLRLLCGRRREAEAEEDEGHHQDARHRH